MSSSMIAHLVPWVALGCLSLWGRATFNSGRSSHRLWLSETGGLFDDPDYSWRSAYLPWTESSRNLFAHTPSEHRHAAAKAMRRYQITTPIFALAMAALLFSIG